MEIFSCELVEELKIIMCRLKFDLQKNEPEY